MKLSELNRLPVHPSANEFPMLDKDAFEGLCEDIATHGMVDAIVLIETSEGLALLDGRNRLKAANAIGLDEVATTVWKGDDPTSFVISTNIHRRHLDTGQKAIMALRFKPHYEDEARRRVYEAGQRANAARAALKRGEAAVTTPSTPPQSSGHATREALAEKLGVGATTIQAAVALSNNAPDLLEDVWQRKATVWQAYKELQRRQKAQQDKVAQWDRHQLARTDPAAHAEQVFADGVTDKLDKAIDLLLDVKRALKKANVPQEFLDRLQGRFNKIADLIDAASDATA